MEKSISLLLYKSLVFILSGVAFAFGSTAFAQEAVADTPVQEYLVLILQFINNLVLPLLFSIALLFFLINVARYFILKGANEADREKAKKLALYGIGAFVFLVSIWGIVNIFVEGLNIDDEEVLCPDYLGSWCYGNYASEGDDAGPFDYYFDDYERSDDCILFNGKEVCG